jgi:hypothetical protein
VGKTIEFAYPNQLFLVVLSNRGSVPAKFEFGYEFINRNPAGVLEKMTPDERARMAKELNLAPEKMKVTESLTFWVLIMLFAFGTLLLLILLYALMKLKQRNDDMVAKVIEITEIS